MLKELFFNIMYIAGIVFFATIAGSIIASWFRRK